MTSADLNINVSCPKFCKLSKFHFLTGHCKKGGANGGNFWGIQSMSTFLLTRSEMDCRRFSCLDVVDDFDYYPLPSKLQSAIFDISKNVE